MGTFMPRVSAAVAVPDPGKHVNYTLGMVLGVDDFTQEFAYLSGRDQWLARDLIGYGTVSGLKVRRDKDEKGPRVLIEPGVALSPRGQLIRVTPAQCAYLNPWLKANKDKLTQHITHKDSPPSDWVRLYVVLCYRDCAIEMTPVPGEPCRSEDELMAPSRLADDFRLELRFEAPVQLEEDALRDFVDWLRQIKIGDTGAASMDDFLAAVRESAHLVQLKSPPASPLTSPPEDFMFGSPPSNLIIPAARAREYLRAAFRVWVTDLRPLWRPNWFREWQCCDQKVPENESPREECLLLAQLDVPIHGVALSDEILVDDLQEVIVNDEQRPFLIHSRLLQEWLLCGRDAQPLAGQIVAAGKFRADGTTQFSLGGLQATRQETDPTLYQLTGPWLNAHGSRFIVKGTPMGAATNTAGLTFEETAERGIGAGLMVRVTGPAGTTVVGFSVEISRYEAA
jgi:hypothetical protein